ncbi:MAG: cofactor-independent phosphoglycerate mutase [Deltaproteobacteria bacterium]|nr:cofactor-independent phosphoglycerate mutase [Deltaproteobacteria bacterium]
MTKYVVLLGDGMADEPHEAFGGLTVMQAANTPVMDALARRGELGLVNTIPPGMSPGSDVANLSAIGYAPERVYSGRAPLEAASIGVRLAPDETALRTNLVTLRQAEGGALVMDDYSAGHISSDDARPLIEALNDAFAGDGVKFYPGVGYRHLGVARGFDDSLKTRAPHDIMGERIDGHLPRGTGADLLNSLMERSRDVFANLPENTRLKTPVTQIWFWGQGKAPTIPTMREQYGLDGAVVSAVDLVRGIGVYLGLKVLHVEGATGWLDTNYAGKVAAAVEFLESGGDFVFVHVEAPDECGHVGKPELKKQAIEDFDTNVVAPMLDYLRTQPSYRLLILPDHPTPLALRTHTNSPVPYVLAGSTDVGDATGRGYNEFDAAATGLVIPSGPDLFRRFLARS